jgi:hypothetical protein
MAENPSSFNTNFKIKKEQFRRLTPGEIEVARKIYKNSINYSTVRITYTNISKGKNITAFTAGNQISFDQYFYSDDFSKNNLGKVSFYYDLHTFIHEMCHVWQNQNASSDALFDKVFFPSPRLSYAYSLQGAKKLRDFNHEQQCEILADYFLKRYYSFVPADSMVYRNRAPLASYNGVLKTFLKNPKDKSISFHDGASIR